MKRVALINDLSGFGKCSLTAAIPVISVMGMQACPLPTAVLTAQTGFDEYYCDDYTDRMDYFIQYWNKMEISFDGICSGYLAGPDQINKVLEFLDKFKKEDTFFLSDPVLGDHGELFKNFDHRLVMEMKKLTRKADVITPNLTELCLLAGAEYFELIKYKNEPDYIQRILAIGKEYLKESKEGQKIIVTGILTEGEKDERIGNLIICQEYHYYRNIHYTGKSFSGTGDLFAAVVCGAMVKGMEAKAAVDRAVYFLQEAIEAASKDNIPAAHGVHFEKYLSRLI